METYRTEEEQVEAIRRWWDENGRSTIVAIVLALATGLGWNYWKDYNQGRNENASHDYQAMLQDLNIANAEGAGDFSKVKIRAEQIKTDYSSSGYAQFAALELAKLAVKSNDLAQAQAQLQWVLGKAPAKSDMADIAQLRLARVLASSGETDQALSILDKGQSGSYMASYAIAKGDIYMQLERFDEARSAYMEAKVALMQTGVSGSIVTLDQKLQSLNPVPARTVVTENEVSSATDASSVEPSDPNAAELTQGQDD